jgi:hypothetical protein
MNGMAGHCRRSLTGTGSEEALLNLYDIPLPFAFCTMHEDEGRKDVIDVLKKL